MVVKFSSVLHEHSVGVNAAADAAHPLVTVHHHGCRVTVKNLKFPYFPTIIGWIGIHIGSFGSPSGNMV